MKKSLQGLLLWQQSPVSVTSSECIHPRVSMSADNPRKAMPLLHSCPEA